MSRGPAQFMPREKGAAPLDIMIGIIRNRLKVDAVIEALGTKASKSDLDDLRAEIVPRLDMLESAMRSR